MSRLKQTKINSREQNSLLHPKSLPRFKHLFSRQQQQQQCLKRQQTDRSNSSKPGKNSRVESSRVEEEAPLLPRNALCVA